MKFCFFLAHPKRLSLFPLPRNGSETAIHPLRLIQDSPPLLIGVLCSLFIKFYIGDEVAFLSLRELSLVDWSSDGVVTFGLSDRALDTADPVSAVPCTVLLETFSLARIWRWESLSLLWITIWLLTPSLGSDAFFPTILRHRLIYSRRTLAANWVTWTSLMSRSNPSSIIWMYASMKRL